MLYPKFTQRYLAAIVGCLILILGISTLFFVYSFHLRRSPLLVESLEKMVPNVYSGKLRDNRLLNTKIHNKINEENNSTGLKVVNANKYFESKKDENIRNVIHNKTNADQFNKYEIPYWEAKENDSSANDGHFSDTIYIDDFERNKTKFFTIEKPTIDNKLSGVGKESFASISYPEFSGEALTVERIRKIERTPLRTNSNERSSPYKIKTQHDFNLDAVYDKSHDSNESIDISEDDDDADDLSVSYGSGSGDFGLRAYSEEDQIHDMPIITDFSKDWVDYGQLTHFNSQKYKENHRMKEKQSKKGKFRLNSDRANKTKQKNIYKTRSKGQRSNNFLFDTDNFRSGSTVTKLPKIVKKNKKEKRRLTTRTKNEHAETSIRPNHANEPFFSTTKERLKLNNNINNKNQEIILTTSIHTAMPASDLNDRKLSKSTMRHSENDNEIYDDLFNKPTVEDPQMNSATWVETRTRRVLGNVRKSEERSRQLLLCEEAGGGELCRMLFKGHTSK